jgi:hypothetical protein
MPVPPGWQGCFPSSRDPPPDGTGLSRSQTMVYGVMLDTGSDMLKVGKLASIVRIVAISECLVQARQAQNVTGNPSTIGEWR